MQFLIGKIIVLLNLISHLSDTDKVYLYAEDTYEVKYKLIIRKRESVGFLFNNRTIWMILTKMLINTIQVRNGKC